MEHLFFIQHIVGSDKLVHNNQSIIIHLSRIHTNTNTLFSTIPQSRHEAAIYATESC